MILIETKSKNFVVPDYQLSDIIKREKVIKWFELGKPDRFIKKNADLFLTLIKKNKLNHVVCKEIMKIDKNE